MQIDGIRTEGWDYFSLAMELLCGIQVEGTNKKGRQGDFV